MKHVKVMILSGEGINCEQETALAFERSGALADIVHVREWVNNPNLISNYQILAFPGGFSYGDELHSGQILALDLKYSVGDELKDFIKNKGLILGICNGFQILMKLGVFEPVQNQERTMTLYHNASFTFLNRWVRCLVPESRCIWTKGLKEITMPSRHGEGRIIFKGNLTQQTHLYSALKNNGQVAITYCDYDNGSFEKVAGITDPTGQVLGLMPHPEAALDSSLYPAGFVQDPQIPSILFKNAIKFAQENLP